MVKKMIKHIKNTIKICNLVIIFTREAKIKVLYVDKLDVLISLKSIQYFIWITFHTLKKIRFYDGVKPFDKMFNNLYNNSCNNKYINKYHYIIPLWVTLYNAMNKYLDGVFHDIFSHVGSFIVSDYLSTPFIFN